MSFEKEKWENLLTQYPGDFHFRGKMLPVFTLALSEFNKKSQGSWNLDDYKILVSVNDDESYAAV